MKRTALIPLALLAVAGAAAVIAGCGSGYGGNSATAASPAGATSVIKTSTGPHGTYLVDGSGRTLYLFEADGRNMSNCDSSCLSIWPAFSATGKPPVAKGGAMAGKVGMTASRDGKQIVTYNGHPLYRYVGDKAAGDTNGQNLDQFGAKWEVVTPAGNGIDGD